MTVTAPKKTVYVGDDLILNLVWQSGTKKTPGPVIDVTGYTFTATIVRNGATVVTGTVTTVPDEGKIKVAFSEAQTETLLGSYEVRLRYTDTNGDTSMFLVMPIEVKQ
ncbi:hypothetical protein [Sinorhizobium meliloti]|uniref:hypothetical protein n=1 Tax=Rhizobium meliloti TaxID=382 RepID=UPI000B49C62C|nr:hypothetical protein [Sinorhizobium meliloti]ASP88151.1 hypothetical protein CDO26_27755 [Sinorhizobium meliloti]MQW25142.1 hypothetical protein [Sinorhizobium meliloti]RVM15363.1 hypothetical protein CN134_14215 [Sinorhizobium meliloti]RVO31069.1 hypothetical protein CN098_13880 [Sinorhizobium meliloti]